LDREISTWKMLADSPQTNSLPKVIFKIVSGLSGITNLVCNIQAEFEEK